MKTLSPIEALRGGVPAAAGGGGGGFGGLGGGGFGGFGGSMGAIHSTSFDHLISAGEQHGRQVEAKRLGSLEADHELELPPTGSNLSAQPNTKPNHTL